MRDYGDYCTRLERVVPRLGAVCRGCYLQLYGGHVRRRWRSGRRRTVLMRQPDPGLARDSVVCYDACTELLALGTVLGSLVIWRLGAEQPQVLEAGLEQRVDKVSIRHGCIILLQGGLVSVLAASDSAHAQFSLQYRRSFESPDPELLRLGGEAGLLARDPRHVPPLAPASLRPLYRPRRPLAHPGLNVTVRAVNGVSRNFVKGKVPTVKFRDVVLTALVKVSTTGARRWAAAVLGEREVSLRCLDTGAEVGSLL